MEESREVIEMWETLRALWASGQYCTLGALHRKSVELYSDASPTIGAIRRRADREMWMNDDALSESISDESKRTATEILNDLGMGLSRSIELLTEIAVAPHEDHDRIKKILDRASETGEIDAKTILGAFKDLRALYTKGMDISLKALHEIFALRGDVGKGASGQPGETEKPMDDMTTEEREVHIKRMYDAIYGHNQKPVDTTDV